MSNTIRTIILSTVFAALSIGTSYAQKDPGPRPGPAGAGGAIEGLSADETAFFTQALAKFSQTTTVSGAGGTATGLGPAYNGNSCSSCHIQPAIGGTTPSPKSPQNPLPNPEVAFATVDGANNKVPFFVTADGPAREARFPSDGLVHDLYTIQGRSDAPGCVAAQPDFDKAAAENNLVFRIPTPLFGLGLVENTPDTILKANLAADAQTKQWLGIGGVFNTSTNDGTITRFGWKGQNKSMLVFAGEAYNVELGVTSELFPDERTVVTGCMFNGTPEDNTNLVSTVGTASEMSSNIVNFAAFIRLLAPAKPTTSSTLELRGQELFVSVGCALCHTPTLTTADSVYTGMSKTEYHPYSDFALHHMGRGLADGITQVGAGPDQFRTAPLWGVGQRLFFLHDGRTSDLLEAIEEHFSPGAPCAATTKSRDCASEANGVIQQFRALSAVQKQEILDFLRSL